MSQEEENQPLRSEDLEMKRRKVIIIGAAGRDFHNFGSLFLQCPLLNF